MQMARSVVRRANVAAPLANKMLFARPDQRMMSGGGKGMKAPRMTYIA